MTQTTGIKRVLHGVARAAGTAVLSASLALSGAVFPAYAQNVPPIVGNGPLSDNDFYNAVSCAAKPGQGCAREPLAWPAFVKRRISIGLVGIQGSDPHFVSQTRNAIESAVSEINRQGAGLFLRYVWGTKTRLANIQIFIVEPEGPDRIITGLNDSSLRGLPINIIRSSTAVLGSGVVSATVVIAKGSTDRYTLQSLVLREILKVLGLGYDLDNPYYDRRSIMSVGGRTTLRRMGEQDIMALWRHYPR